VKKKIVKRAKQKTLGTMWKGERNVDNRTLFIGDNLPMLEGINTETVDLIYLDPPFNSNRNYSAPIGSDAAGASFRDAWTLDMIDEAWIGQLAEHSPKLMQVINAVGEAGGKGDKSYLVFMARRLLEMHRVLKESGSIYLHCDPTMAHSLKLVMDCIFGTSNFRNEIIWLYGKMANVTNNYIQNHDTILFYSKSANWSFNVLKKEDSEYKERWKKYVRKNRIHYGDVKDKKDKMMQARIAKISGGGGKTNRRHSSL